MTLTSEDLVVAETVDVRPAVHRSANVIVHRQMCKIVAHGGIDAFRAPFRCHVVLERMPAAGSFEMLGVINVRGVGLASDAPMFDQLKERAAAQGADAVVLQAPIRSDDNARSGEIRVWLQMPFVEDRRVDEYGEQCAQELGARSVMWCEGVCQCRPAWHCRW